MSYVCFVFPMFFFSVNVCMHLFLNNLVKHVLPTIKAIPLLYYLEIPYISINYITCLEDLKKAMYYNFSLKFYLTFLLLINRNDDSALIVADVSLKILLWMCPFTLDSYPTVIYGYSDIVTCILPICWFNKKHL